VPPRKREHRRTGEDSWQNNPEKPAEVNRHGRKPKGEPEYLDHPKNANGQNICGANTQRGKKCQLPAGQKTDHENYGKCSFHGGNTPTLRASAAKYMGGEVIDRMTNAYGLGGPVKITPEDALLQEVARSSGHVGFLQDRINMFDLKLGEEVLSEAKAELIEMYQKERLMLTKVAKAALDAGVAMAKVQMERQKGVQLVEVLREVFDSLGLSVEQQRMLPVLVPQALRKLTEPKAVMQLEQPPLLNGG
jgi:hypothetical protein